MRRSIAFCAGSAVIAAGAVIGAARHAGAEALVENSAEFRMQLDFEVKDAALAKLLPAGWEPAVATAGPGQGLQHPPDLHRPHGHHQAGRLPGGQGIEPTRLPRGPGEAEREQHAGQMLIYGLTADAKDAPGPFGVFTHATTAKMSRSVNSGPSGDPLVTEDWEFAAAGGEHMEIHLKYERGTARKSANNTPFWSAKNPSYQQMFKIEQGLDIMRNATVQVKDRVKEFTYKAGGGKIAPLFDGTDKVVSVDALHWYNRGVYLP